MDPELQREHRRAELIEEQILTIWNEEWAREREADEERLAERRIAEVIGRIIRFVEFRLSQLREYVLRHMSDQFIQMSDQFIQRERDDLNRSVEESRRSAPPSIERLGTLESRYNHYIDALHRRLYWWRMFLETRRRRLAAQPLAMDENALEDIRAYQAEYPDPPPISEPPDPRKAVLLTRLLELCTDVQDPISLRTFQELDYAELRTIVMLLDDGVLAHSAEGTRSGHCFVAKGLHDWVTRHRSNPLNRARLNPIQMLHIRRMYKTYLSVKGDRRTAEEDREFQRL